MLRKWFNRIFNVSATLVAAYLTIVPVRAQTPNQSGLNINRDETGFTVVDKQSAMRFDERGLVRTLKMSGLGAQHKGAAELQMAPFVDILKSGKLTGQIVYMACEAPDQTIKTGVINTLNGALQSAKAALKVEYGVEAKFVDANKKPVSFVPDFIFKQGDATYCGSPLNLAASSSDWIVHKGNGVTYASLRHGSKNHRINNLSIYGDRITTEVTVTYNGQRMTGGLSVSGTNVEVRDFTGNRSELLTQWLQSGGYDEIRQAVQSISPNEGKGYAANSKTRVLKIAFVGSDLQPLALNALPDLNGSPLMSAPVNPDLANRVVSDRYRVNLISPEGVNPHWTITSLPQPDQVAKPDSVGTTVPVIVPDERLTAANDLHADQVAGSDAGITAAAPISLDQRLTVAVKLPTASSFPDQMLTAGAEPEKIPLWKKLVVGGLGLAAVGVAALSKRRQKTVSQPEPIATARSVPSASGEVPLFMKPGPQRPTASSETVKVAEPLSMSPLEEIGISKIKPVYPVADASDSADHWKNRFREARDSILKFSRSSNALNREQIEQSLNNLVESLSSAFAEDPVEAFRAASYALNARKEHLKPSNRRSPSAKDFEHANIQLLQMMADNLDSITAANPNIGQRAITELLGNTLGLGNSPEAENLKRSVYGYSSRRASPAMAA